MLQGWFVSPSLWQILEGYRTEQEWYYSVAGVHTFEDWMPGAILKKSFDTGVESHTCYSKLPLCWKGTHIKKTLNVTVQKEEIIDYSFCTNGTQLCPQFLFYQQ